MEIGGYSSEMLKAINVKIFTNQDCGQKWGNLFDANTMMCAAGSISSICVVGLISILTI
jgi:hypothetical protein